MQEISSKQLQKTLKDYFGYSHFKGNQEAIIKHILKNKDTFVIMPTGGGKSLCYQLPAILQEGTAIIISPLIALMKDQVDHMQHLGIQAALLNSTLTTKVIQHTKQALLAGNIKMLYVAPETLTKEENLDLFKQLKISFIAVDEAHCISDWGHDFRPEYRNIRCVANQQNQRIPIIALTATATPRVKLDIINNLEIKEATLFQSSFNRANLYYETRLKEDQSDKQLIKLIKSQEGKTGIVYCQSRKQVDELANLLTINDIRAAPYHAGLDAISRVKNQEAFLKKSCDVIVATIAFGMGIDTPDVRFIIHYDLPKSLESYYQETGRAGRDNLPSNCFLFYSEEDFTRLERLNKIKPHGEREKANDLLEEVRAYALSGMCRRQQLLYYFGESFQAPCDHCDNCKQNREKFNATNYLALVLNTIQQIKEQFNTEHVINIIRGIQTAHIKSCQHEKLSYFGKGEEIDDCFWKSIIRQGIINGFLNKNIIENNVLMLTQAGRNFLNNQHPINFVKDGLSVPIQTDKKQINKSTMNKNYDENLFSILQKIREKVAKEKGIPAYTVLQDTSLEEMALVYPTNLDELAQIGGLSMGKAIKFGAPFINAIRKYVEDNDIVTSCDILVKSKASRSKDKVYIIQQIDRKIDLEEIASTKFQTMEELLDEIEAICYSGVKLNLSYYIDNILTKEQQKEIYNYFMQAKEDNIKKAYKVLGKYYNEEDIRLMHIKFLSEVAN